MLKQQDFFPAMYCQIICLFLRTHLWRFFSGTTETGGGKESIREYNKLDRFKFLARPCLPPYKLSPRSDKGGLSFFEIWRAFSRLHTHPKIKARELRDTQI